MDKFINDSAKIRNICFQVKNGKNFNTINLILWLEDKIYIAKQTQNEFDSNNNYYNNISKAFLLWGTSDIEHIHIYLHAHPFKQKDNIYK